MSEVSWWPTLYCTRGLRPPSCMYGLEFVGFCSDNGSKEMVVVEPDSESGE